MAPFASREESDHDAVATRAGVATQILSPDAPRAPPTLRSAPSLAGRGNAGRNKRRRRRRRPAINARPGISFQEQLLRELHATAVPAGSSTPPPSPSCCIWITPPFRAPRFNASYLSAVLSFHLTAPPDLLRARRVGGGFAFRSRVANQDVASFIAARGHLVFHRQRFCLHASEEAAMAAAAELEDEDAFNARHQPASGGSSKLQEHAVCCLPAAGHRARSQGKIASDPLVAAPGAPGLLPLPGQDAWLRRDSAAQRLVTSGFTALHPPPNPKPYLQALLSPPSLPSPSPPTTRTRRRPAPIPRNHQGCFRCLATDHKVRDCRDPIHCRLCRGSGHRSYACRNVPTGANPSHPRRRPHHPPSRRY